MNNRNENVCLHVHKYYSDQQSVPQKKKKNDKKWLAAKLHSQRADQNNLSVENIYDVSYAYNKVY